MNPKDKAAQLYTDAYTRWCYELSHDKNELTAKSIAEYVCNEVLGHMGADRGYEFWSEVKRIVATGGHRELYNSNKIRLSERDTKILSDALTNPPQPNPALMKAAGRYGIWERIKRGLRFLAWFFSVGPK